MNPFIHAGLYLSSAAVSSAVAAYCWRRRSRPGVTAFAVVAGAQALWTLGFVMELIAGELEGKVFWDNVQFLAYAVIPVGFLAFAQQYTGRRGLIRKNALLAAPLLAVALLAFIHPLDGPVRQSPRLVPAEPFTLLTYGFTPLVLASAAYTYLLFLVAVVLLAAASLRAHRLYRTQVNVVLLGALTPVVGSVLTVTVLRDSPSRDLTPLTFAAGNLVIAWGLFRRGLFDVVPMARHAVVESLSDAVFVLDAGDRVVDLNEAARTAAGGPGARGMVGRPATEVLPFGAELLGRLGVGARGALETELAGAGGCRQVEVVAHAIPGPHGERAGRVLVVRDITDRKRAELELREHRDRLEELVAERTAQVVASGAALRESDARLRQIADNSQEVFWLMELDGRAAYLSPAFDRVFGVPRERVGLDWRAVLQAVPAAEHELLESLWAEASGGRPAEATYRVARPDGPPAWVVTRAFPVFGARGEVCRVAGVTEDVTERRRMEDRIAHDAFHDALTGLPNRALFEDRLRHALDLLPRQGDRGCAVLILALDRFKRVNDSFGHSAGDELLRAVSERLRGVMRRGDTVARFGGDEFALLLDDLPGADGAMRTAGGIQDGIAVPFAIGGDEVFVTASIGIALSDPAAGPEELVRKAHTAMHRAKERGGGHCEVFGREMHARAVSRLQLEGELRRALERGELRVAYQPIVDLATGRAVAFEALVRWLHPERGLLAPGSFLDVAEEAGLVIAMDRWVMREACAQLRRWTATHPDRALSVSVNFSPRQFAQPDLVDFVEATLAEAGVAADSVRLEITEGVLVGRDDEKVLGRLRDRGVHLVIDDFGTGYSCLSYLHRLPISALKVDRSFVGREAGNFAIVGAVTTLAHTLGMGVVVEGVERAEHVARLRDLGADCVQGYLFSPPVDAKAAGALLERNFIEAGMALDTA
ncbi:MAG TPA: EAL domain-containing protein [Longimicrobium sp.]|nr:EAL domain-containing protein [Longimicrobium sp.]